MEKWILLVFGHLKNDNFDVLQDQMSESFIWLPITKVKKALNSKQLKGQNKAL